MHSWYKMIDLREGCPNNIETAQVVYLLQCHQMDIHVFGQISHIRLELPPTEIVGGDGGIEVALVKNLDLM